MQSNGNYYNDEMEIDLLDLCKVLLSKWKWLLCGLLCGLIAALGFTALKPSPTVLSVEEQEKQLLENLSESDKNYVEDLYQSYNVMNRRIDILRTRLSSSQINSFDLDENDRVMKQTYFVVDSSIRGMNIVVAETGLTSSDYETLSDILYGDKDHTAETVQRVFLSNVEENSSQLAAEDDNSPYELVCLTAVSDSAEKVDDASEYVEEVLTKKNYAIDGNDSSVKITVIDHMYSEDQNTIVQALYETFETDSNSLYNAEVALNNLQTNYISKLSGDSKTYFSLLSNEDISAVTPKKYKRNGLLGALLGLFAACAWFALKYIFDGTVKTVSDLCWLLKGDMPHELKATKDHTIDAAEILAAEDISIKLKQKEKKALFITVDESVKDIDSVQKTINAIKERFSGDVRIGDPCVSSEDMKQLSESDAVVMIVPIKQEKVNKVLQAEQLCRGYNAEIIDVVAI